MEWPIVPVILWQVRQLRKADRRPLRETLALRDETLAALLGFSRAHSAFYAEFHHGLESAPLEELPVLTKSVMMDNFDRIVTDNGLRLVDVERYLERLPEEPFFHGRYRVCSTSGSSGRRGFFLFSPAEWATAIASFRRSGSWCGIPLPLFSGRVAAVTSPVPWHMSAQAGSSVRVPWMKIERLDPTEHPEALVERLNRFRPELLSVYPSVGRMLAKEQAEGRLDISPKVIMTGSETLTLGVRSLMERAWGKNIFDHYGATETGSIAAECRNHRLHVVEDLLVVEGVDRENRPVPAGVTTDKLLVTVLFRRTQPLIRYEISDRVVFSDEACGCGLPWRVMERVEGREEENLCLPALRGGTRIVHPVVFEKVLDNLPASGWQVTSDGEHVTVFIAGANGVDPDAVAENLRRELDLQDVAPVLVSVRKVGELQRTPTGKAAHVRKTRP
jgi:phenylacetate-CoA ligase